MNGEELSDREIERFVDCLLPCAYCLLAVWAWAGGDNYGHIVRNKGRGNVPKRGDFQGVWAAKEGSEGRIWGPGSRKKVLFLRAGGVIGGRRGVFGLESDIKSGYTPARELPPAVGWKGENSATRRHGPAPLIGNPRKELAPPEKKRWLSGTVLPANALTNPNRTSFAHTRDFHTGR